MNLKIALLEHSEKGALIMKQAIKCIHAIEENYNHHFSISKLKSLKREASYWLNEESLQSCKNSDVVFSSLPISRELFYKNNQQANINLVQALDCHATVAPILAFPNELYTQSYKNEKSIDFVLFSALKSGFYNNIPAENIESDHYKNNIQGVHHLFHLAFKTAKNRRQRLQVVKPNGPNKLKIWEKTLNEISLSYPMVKLSFVAIEEMVQLMISSPENLDCVFADEIQGCVLQAQSKSLSEVTYLLPTAHMGMGINFFEPLSEIDISNQKASPISVIYSVALMLSRFGLQEEARAIQIAINNAAQRGMFTKNMELPDFVSCDQLGDFISAAVIDAEDIGNLNDENIDLGKSTII